MTATSVHRSTRYCAECGCNAYEMAQPPPGYWRKECAECGSCGPFMAENPHYGPGNPDFERDREREATRG